jgi:hypothetical protein
LASAKRGARGSACDEAMKRASRLLLSRFGQSALPAKSASGRGEKCMSELLVCILRRCMAYMASAPLAPEPRLARFAE